MHLKQRFWDAVHAVTGFFSVSARAIKEWNRYAARQTMLHLNVPYLEVPDAKDVQFAASQIVGTQYWKTIKIQLLSESETFRAQIAQQLNLEAKGFREKFINAQIEIRAREDFIITIEKWAQQAEEQEELENDED